MENPMKVDDFPPNGWFISWKIPFIWMIQGYLHLWKPPYCLGIKGGKLGNHLWGYPKWMVYFMGFHGRNPNLKWMTRATQGYPFFVETTWHLRGWDCLSL